MPPPYEDPQSRARKIGCAVRGRVQGQKQDSIAAATGLSPSTVSRLMSEHLDNLCAVLAHAGMKVVPVEMVCVPEPTFHEMRRLSARVYACDVVSTKVLTEDWD